MTEKRTDTEGRELFCGEYERQDGRYEYRYKTREGKRSNQGRGIRHLR